MTKEQTKIKGASWKELNGDRNHPRPWSQRYKLREEEKDLAERN